MNHTNTLAKASMVRALKSAVLVLGVVFGLVMVSYCVVTNMPVIGRQIHRSPGAYSYDVVLNWDSTKNVGHFATYADMKEMSGLANVYIVSDRSKMWTCDAETFGDWVYMSGSHEIMYCAHEVRNWIVWNATKEDDVVMQERVAIKRNYQAAMEWSLQEYRKDVADFKYLELDTSAVIAGI